MESNERYEFLGDAILEFWTTKILFKKFPNLNEGKLTNLRSLIVCTPNLAKTAQKINLGQYLLLSKGEEANGGRHNPSLLADSFESLLGAVYLDLGLAAADRFLKKLLLPSILSISGQKIYKDPKSLFQELAQARLGITPEYKTVKETGPDHQKTFKVGVYLGAKLVAAGTGSSKQTAAAKASKKASKIIENKV